MSLSKQDFESLKQFQQISTFEHVGLQDEFLVDPECLVVLEAPGYESKIFGLYYYEVEDLKDAILFRATEMIGCSMVDEILTECEARLVTREGEARFSYDMEKYRFEVKK